MKKRRLSKLERLKAVLDGHPITMTKEQRDDLHRRHAFLGAMLSNAALGAAQVDYDETSNPIHLLIGFVTARQAGIPVPEWVLQPLTAAMEKVLKGKGKTTLDRALRGNLKKGQRNIWTTNEQHQQDARLKWLFDQQIKKGLPLTSDKVGVPNAVREVANQLGREQEKDSVLLQTYYKRLKKHSSRLSRSRLSR